MTLDRRIARRKWREAGRPGKFREWLKAQAVAKALNPPSVEKLKAFWFETARKNLSELLAMQA
jgi:hypothetical protein